MANDRNTPRRDGLGLRLPVAAAVRLYAGRMVGVNADGNAVPAGNAAAIVAGILRDVDADGVWVEF